MRIIKINNFLHIFRLPQQNYISSYISKFGDLFHQRINGSKQLTKDLITEHSQE